MQTYYPAFHAEYWIYLLAAFVIVGVSTLLYTVDGPINFYSLVLVRLMVQKTGPVRPLERGLFAIFSPLNSLADIDRHPLFVFGERRVRLLQIAEFTRSFGESGTFVSSALNSAAFARYCFAENI